ncbi:MAG: cache domain-containing protein, partial [Treponema sp.]|nr:cache domain-containing protein [Treponema sp.]
MPKQNFVKTIKTKVTRFSYAPVLAVAAAFALMVILSSYFMVNIVNEQLVYNARKALDSLETSIKTDLKEPRTVLGNQSECIRNMILRGAGKEEVHIYLNEITGYILHSEQNLSGFISIFGYFDVYGGALLDGMNRPPPEGYKPNEDFWYIEAAAAGGNIVFFQPHTEMFTSKTIITYARALFDNEGNLLGVVVLDVQLERIREYIVKANLGKLGFGVLLNEQIEFIAHVDPELHGTKFKNLDSGSLRRIAELNPGQDLYELEYVSYLGDPSIASIRKMENGWYIVIVTPKEEYFSELRNIRLILSALGAVLALILIVILLRIIAEKQKSDAKARDAEEKTRTTAILQNILNNLDSMIFVNVPKTGEILFINNQM